MIRSYLLEELLAMLDKIGALFSAEQINQELVRRYEVALSVHNYYLAEMYRPHLH